MQGPQGVQGPQGPENPAFRWAYSGALPIPARTGSFPDWFTPGSKVCDLYIWAPPNMVKTGTETVYNNYLYAVPAGRLVPIVKWEGLWWTLGYDCAVVPS